MPAAGRVPGASAPTAPMRSSRLITTGTGWAAVRSHQSNSPKASELVPTAVPAKTTRAPRLRCPPDASWAKDQNTSPLAAPMRASVQSTGRWRSLMASRDRSSRRRRREAKRSTAQSASPKSRSSLAAGASTAIR